VVVLSISSSSVLKSDLANMSGCLYGKEFTAKGLAGNTAARES